MPDDTRAHKLSAIMTDFNAWRETQPNTDQTFDAGCVIAIVTHLRKTLSEQEVNTLMCESINTGHVLARM